VVIERAGSSQGGKAKWRALCRCGNETITTGAHLRERMTKSCGCLKRETKPNKDRPS